MEQQDVEQLEHIANTLKNEKKFMLWYLRQLARGDTEELPAITVQFNMQREFIADIRTRETKHKIEKNETDHDQLLNTAFLSLQSV